MIIFILFAVILSTSNCLASSLFCENDKSFRFTHNNNRKNCQWVRDQTEENRMALCQTSDIRSNCRISCGICCDDNPFYRVIDPNNTKSRSCSWIGSKQERKNAYCDLQRGGGSSKVRDSCPLACDHCADFVVLEGGAFEVEPIASSPTLAPSRRYVANPSTYPTTNPSTSPTISPTRRYVANPSTNPSSKPSTHSSPKPSTRPSLNVYAKPSTNPSESALANQFRPTVSPSRNAQIGQINGEVPKQNKKSFPYGIVFGSISAFAAVAGGIVAFIKVKKDREAKNTLSAQTKKYLNKLRNRMRRK